MDRPASGESDDAVRERLRRLPSVERLAASLDGLPHAVATAAARVEIDAARAALLAGEELEAEGLRESAERRARELAAGGLRTVINATGVVLHTNLGRAPLAPEAAEAAAQIASTYSNLEYDLEGGRRGSRAAHLEPLICELTGAEAALAVNNNAAAVLLALAALAAGREAIVSRGELIEIGDSFRIPDVLAASGAHLVDVGTTNRTRLYDYEQAIGADTAVLLRVHQSNFRMVGFTERATLLELCRLAKERGLSVIDDLGSGALNTIADEPTPRESVAAGADLVCFSADKLLGGPQAGIIVGRADAVERCRRDPLARALRLDKLQLAALEATLRLHRDAGPRAIPALAMLGASEEELLARVERMLGLIGEAARSERASAIPGGGSLPEVELEGPVCAIDAAGHGADQLLAALRCGKPPVIARIERGRVILDPRAMSDAEAECAAARVCEALRD